MAFTNVRIKPIYILSILTLLGGYFRFIGLGDNGLWCDEGWFGLLSYSPVISQEFIPAYIVRILNLQTEFELRFMFALAGTLSIPAIYIVLKNNKLEASAVMALFPLFIFWSRMSRPYAVAGLFVILAWRWWMFILPAMLTTPIAIIGLRLIKQKSYVIVYSLTSALVLYLIREDSARGWTISQIFDSSRWFYIPAITVILYVCDKYEK